jgi:hypothetical protein
MAPACCILGKFLEVIAIVSPAFRRSHFSPPDASMSPSTRVLQVAKGGTVGENGPVILPKLHLFTPFRDLLHAASLRHGKNGFTSLPKARCFTCNLAVVCLILHFRNDINEMRVVLGFYAA